MRLTRSEDRVPVYVNVDSIQLITGWANYTEIYFRDGNEIITLKVSESSEDIAKSCAPTKRMGEGEITVYHG